MRNVLALSLLSLYVLFTSACSDRPHLAFGNVVTVRVVSDYAAGVEVVRAETTLSRGERGASSARLQSFDTNLTTTDDLLAGHVVAESMALEDGTYTVQVSLRDRAGAMAGARALTFDVAGDTTVTVHITSSCRDVVCPDGACFGGRCVDARCSVDAPEHCPPKAVCGSGEDCEGESACAMAACIEGVCGFAPTENACGSDEYYAREEGCAPIDMPDMPDGPDSRCGRVCAIEGDVCRYGYFACTEREDGSIDVVCTSFVARPVGSPCGEGLVCDEAALCVEHEAIDGGSDGGSDAGVDAAMDGAVVVMPDMGLPDMCSRFITVPRDPTCNPDVNACAVVTVCADTYDAGRPDAAIDASMVDMAVDSGPTDPEICRTELLVTTVVALEPYLACTSLVGITFNDASEVTDLSLPNLVAVTGRISIMGDNAVLQSLDLPLLEYARDVYVVYNSGLTTIGLPALREVGGWFAIYANYNVTSLDVSELKSVGESGLYISNMAVSTLDLGSLTEVGGKLEIVNMPNLDAVNVDALVSVGGDVTVRDNPLLCEFIESSQLVDFADTFSFVRGAMCTDPDYCAGGVNITDEASLDPYRVCGTLGTVYCGPECVVDTIDLPNLRVVTGDINLQDGLVETLDLTSLTTIGGFVYINDSPRLERASLPGLQTVGGYVYLSLNEALETVDLSSLYTIGRHLYVTENAGLSTLSLSSLYSIAEYVYVDANPLLCDVVEEAQITMTGAGYYYYVRRDDACF